MISAVFALLASVQCSITSYDELVGVPVKRTTYAARTEIKAAFDNHASNFQADGLVHAEMLLKTKRPTLNLVNFIQIQNIKCAKNQAELYFDGNETARLAYEEWSVTKDLTMMVSQTFGCDGSNVAFLDVVSIQMEQNILKLQMNLLKTEQVIDEYQLDISKYENTEQLFEWDIEKELAVFPLNLNYDAASKSVSRPEIPLYQNEYAQFACMNCHTRGEAKLRVLLTGSALSVKTYKLKLEGGITANLDLKAGLKTMPDKQLFMVTLYSYALNPVQVPGVFKFGPELRIKAGATYGSSSELALTTGFEVDFPFNFQVYSDNGLTTKPQFAFNGKPTPTPHPLTLSNGEIHLDAHLIPEIALNVEIVQSTLDLTVAMDNVLGAEASTLKKCDAAPVQVLLYHKHSVGVDANVMDQKYNWSLWNTGRLPIKCFFCDKCPRQ